MKKRKPKILTRYNAASPTEFLHYVGNLPMRYLCRKLGRHERTIKDWMNGRAVIPPWAVAVLRLDALELELMRDQMGYTEIERRIQQPASIPARLLRPPANESLYASPLIRSELSTPAVPGANNDAMYAGTRE
ncbi:hypothetical protein GXB81_05585 [Paraburkholderia sp. Ac-20336]|uniref:hypothetical protein n=1 Tax=Paraburkholderia sp. Ac-20336 TaxID=2703886 RepID=UPI00197F4B75|nr:hypothetical protein [Paraburkholderia sp. Ac-20336]MBN3802527.1 hypothetical protein [Paraburkholderia sp. Ac-20336]